MLEGRERETHGKATHLRFIHFLPFNSQLIFIRFFLLSFPLPVDCRVLFGLGGTRAGILNCPSVIENLMRSASPPHLFFLLTHELVLFYGFIVIFALSVKALTWLHNFIEHPTPNSTVILPDATQYC